MWKLIYLFVLIAQGIAHPHEQENIKNNSSRNDGKSNNFRNTYLNRIKSAADKHILDIFSTAAKRYREQDTEGVFTQNLYDEYWNFSTAEYEETDFNWDKYLFQLNSFINKTEIEEFIPDEYKGIVGLDGAKIWKILFGLLSLSKYYLPTTVSNSPSCQKALRSLLLPKNWMFTLKMIDSWGKLPDGVLWGNFRPLGMYEECMHLRQQHLHGRYCHIQLSKNPAKEDDEKLKQVEINPLMAPVIIEGSNVLGIFSYGTCIPNACTEEDMMESLTNTLDETNKNNSVSMITCRSLVDEREPLTGGDISFIVFSAVVCLLLLCSTAFDVFPYLKASSITKGPLTILLAFSLPRNFDKLFSIDTKPPKDNITCIHGLRVFSMMWVIYGHQYAYSIPNTYNLADLGRKTSGILFQIFANGSFCVDSFFFLSGLLAAYMGLKVMSRSHGKLGVSSLYVHRYLRLTPNIAIAAWFYATLARFMVSGPYAENFEPRIENCRNNWWKDLLYINNYATSLGVPGQADCINQAWYTAVDTQIFIFVPLVLIPLYHFQRAGKMWLAFLTLVSCIIPGAITVALNLPPYDKLNNDEETALKYWKYIYVAPFSRAGPYFIGIWVGYILHVSRGSAIKLNMWLVIFGWFSSTLLALTILFGIYNYNTLGQDAKTEYTAVMQFFYGGFSRALWAVPLGWIVIACHSGYGGPVNRILSHPTLQPLSRLTYSMFIMGLGIQLIVIFNNKQLLYFSHLNKISETCGSLFFAGVAATILAVFIEMPIQNLEKEILG